MRVRRAKVTTLMIAAAVAVAGCGGSDDEADGPAAAATPSVGDAVQVGDATEAEAGGEPAPGPPAEVDPDPPGGVGNSGAASCISPPEAFTGADLKSIKQATLCLLNAERTARKLRPLKSERRLTAAATAHSQDMVKRKFFAHDSPSGSKFNTRIADAGYRPGVILGENVGTGVGTSALPRVVVDTWMKSPPHRANILQKRYKEIGLGIVLGTPKGGGGPALTYSAAFGSRR